MTHYSFKKKTASIAFILLWWSILWSEAFFLTTVLAAEADEHPHQHHSPHYLRGANDPTFQHDDYDPSSPNPPAQPQQPTNSGTTAKDLVVDDQSANNNEEAFDDRFIVKCHVPQTECLESISSIAIIFSSNITIIHNLEDLHSVAVQVKDSDALAQLQVLFEVHDDPTREPLHLPESLRILSSFSEQRQLNRNDANENENEQDSTTPVSFASAQSIPQGLDLSNIPSVWPYTQGQGVTVCVMDTGLDDLHPDFEQSNLDGSLSRELVQPWNRDGTGHGTHVTGTIAAADNDFGVVGAAPLVDVFVVRVFDSSGIFRGSDVVAAAEECRRGGADIINMSLGGSQSVDEEEELFYDYYWRYNILAVAAAGNSGRQSNVAKYPAAYDTVVSVAAVNQNGDYATFSTRNRWVDVAAMGVGVVSTYKNENYAALSGTSMATPHVAGVAALLKSMAPSATPRQLYQALTETAISDEDGRNDRIGYGIVNAQAALQNLASKLGINLPPTSPPTQSPTIRSEPTQRPTTRAPTPSPTPGPTERPTPSPTAGPTASPTFSPTSPPTTSFPSSSPSEAPTFPDPCEDGLVQIQMTIVEDRYGTETSWEVRTDDVVDTPAELVLQGGPYTQNTYRTVEESICVDPSQCYEATIFDTYGDGLCCTEGQGSYRLVFGGRVIADSGGIEADFEQVKFQFGNCTEGTDGSEQGDEEEGETEPCADLVLTIKTDEYGYDTSYTLQQRTVDGTAPFIWSIQPGSLLSSATYEESVCLPLDKCYELGIYDSFGDGFVGEDRGVRVEYNGEVKFSGGNIRSGGVMLIGDACY